jgi:ATP-dependent DNA helicase HFM1/MER3
MYPIKEAVNQTRHKVSLMIQAHLGCVQYPDSSDAAKARRQLMMERKLVFERLNRLVRAVIDCKGHDRDSVGTKTALELARALAAESWEGRATQLTQVPNIGPVGMRKLASKDIRTVLQLADKDYDEIERLMSRQPPYGKNLQAHLDKFPRLAVEAVIVGHRVQPRSEEPVLVEVKATLRYLNRKGPPNWLSRVPALTFLVETGDGTLVYFWRGSIKKLDKQAGFELKFSVGLRDVKDHVVCHFSCEEIVGTIVSTTLEPKLPASIFPSRRPAADISVSRSRKEDSQEYNDDIDDSDLILAAEQALVHSSTKQGASATFEPNIDEFPSVEELVELDGTQAADKFDNHLAGHDEGDEMDSSQMIIREPVRLPNGKWQCNHACSGGAPTRSGNPCNHKCCREGLDKPRKRPLQRPKRKRDEPDRTPVDARPARPTQTQPQQQPRPVYQSGGPGVKRQKVQGVPSLTQSTLTSSFKGPAKTSQDDWNAVGFDDLALECIDLSFTDDEDEDIFKLLGSASRRGDGSDVPNKANGKTGVLETQENDTSHLEKSLSTKPATRRPAAAASTQQDEYEDDFLDDPSFSFVQERRLPSPKPVTPPSTATAFKSGGSDEVLYQGISKKFAETTHSSPRWSIHRKVTTTSPKTDSTGKPSSPLSVDDMPEMTMDPSPSSSAAAEPVVSPTTMGKPGTGAADNTSKKQVVKDNEPAWLAEFDPEFVDMFRGYVTFV